jgi:hypothetical protein
MEEDAPTIENVALTMEEDAPTIENVALTMEEDAPTIGRVAPTIERDAPTIERVALTIERVALPIGRNSFHVISAPFSQLSSPLPGKQFVIPRKIAKSERCGSSRSIPLGGLAVVITRLSLWGACDDAIAGLYRAWERLKVPGSPTEEFGAKR